MDIWVWQSYFYVFKREENKKQYRRVDTKWLPCDAGLEAGVRAGAEEATQMQSPRGSTFARSNLGAGTLRAWNGVMALVRGLIHSSQHGLWQGLGHICPPPVLTSHWQPPL